MTSGNWLRHTMRRTTFQPQRQMIALGTLGLFVAIIIGALYLSQSSASSTLGRELENLILERSMLEQSNEQLRAEIASLQSIPQLTQRAQDLGFSLATEQNIEYLVVDGYNPDRNRVAAAIQAENSIPVSVPVYEESFLGWVQQQWDNFSRQAGNVDQVSGGG